MAKTLSELEKAYHNLFYVEDKALFALLLSIVVGSKMSTPTTWIYIVGPSSGGKGTVLSVLNKIKFIEQVSDLTPNTLLSGMTIAGKETSLLNKLGNNFCVTMKDYTTLISKDETAQGQIMAQMREVYDGYYTKMTGNGKTLAWGTKEKPWKSTFIMATTEEIYSLQEKFVGMGTRAINYVFEPQDRKKTMRASLLNKKNNEVFTEKLTELQNDVRDFVDEMITNAPTDLPPIPEMLEDEIIDVADLASKCRSVVKRDYRGEKSLALSAEFPMRMGEQLLAIAQLMAYINGGELTPTMKACIHKCAFDSIPKQRRIIMEIVARHPKIEIIGLAMQINYPPNLVRAWVEDLNMFAIVDREKHGRKEYWRIKPEYRATLVKYLGIEQVDYDLESDEQGEVSGRDMTWEEQQAQILAEKNFNESFTS